MLLERQRVRFADDDARRHYARTLVHRVLGRKSVIYHLLIAVVGVVWDGDGGGRYLIDEREAHACTGLDDFVYVIHDIIRIDVSSISSLCYRIPGQRDVIVGGRSLDAGRRCWRVLAHISRNLLALASRTLIVRGYDRVSVYAVLRPVVYVVLLAARLYGCHLLYLLTVAHDVDVEVRGELGAVDSLCRGSEVEYGFSRTVLCRHHTEVGGCVRSLLRIALHGDVVKDKLVEVVAVGGAMETDVESAVFVRRKLCLQRLILHVGYLGLGHKRVCHRFGCRLAAVLHLQLLGERLAHACHTERHVIHLTLLQLERRHDEPVVMTVLAIAILYLCRRLTCSVVLAELPCGAVIVGVDDGEEV